VRAAWVSRLGPPSVVAVVDRPDPVPGPGEVLVGVRAAAVNFPDVLVIAGKYQVPAPVPFIPGSEFAGVVRAVGAGVPPRFVGRRVIGTTFTGAFAEQVAVPAEAVQPAPAGLDDVHAAAFAVAYRTAYHAIVTAGAARAGQTMVVLGAAGGVGLASVDVGAALGIRVLAAASSADRVALACSRGAATGIDYSTEDLKQRIRELTGGQGADIVIDPVGGRYAEPALRAMAWGGRFVCVGFAAGAIPCIPLNLVLLKGSSSAGSRCGRCRGTPRQPLPTEIAGWKSSYGTACGPTCPASGRWPARPRRSKRSPAARPAERWFSPWRGPRLRRPHRPVR
jgi:NADPH2:quinone reductase